MLSAFNRMAFQVNLPFETRRVALDLMEVIIRWEVYRKQEATEASASGNAPGSRVGQMYSTPISHKRSYDKMDSDSPLGAASESSGTPKKELPSKVASGPILKEQAEMIMNLLIRFPISLYEINSTITSQHISTIYASQAVNTPIITTEYLSKRALALIRIVFQTDIWPNLDIRVSHIERALMSKENNSSYNLICTALELLSIFLHTMKKEQVLKIFINLQKAIFSACTCTNGRVVRAMHSLLCKLMSIFPPSCSNMTISPKSGASVKVSSMCVV